MNGSSRTGATALESSLQSDSPGLRLTILADDRFLDFRLPQTGDVIIGRDASSTIVTDHPSVSRRHALLRLGSAISITDLKSSNGTYLGGRKLKPGRPEPLQPGEVVGIGRLRMLLYQVPGAPESKAVVAGPGVSLTPSTVLLNPKMAELYRMAASIALGNISVLIVGETGTGKEILAETIHLNSGRRDRPLLRLNCAALSETLLESELFGHEKGAFTGATQAKLGLLETAQGGTVFLDEIGEMPRGLQAKLLRVLEDRMVMPVGGLRERSIDVRFISATNRDIGSEGESGSFRRDLYYRLSGATLHIPPLRDRPSEIEPLARLFLDKVTREAGKRPPALSPGALERLRSHSWPGNIRELRNAMERAALLCGDELRPEHLPEPRPAALDLGPNELRAAAGGQGYRFAEAPTAGGDELSRIVDALESCAGNQTQAARLLGMSRGTLLSRLNDYGMPRPRKPVRFRP